MWQRFTERARRVIFYAQEEAGRLGENYVSTEHLLLGLVRENDSVAARILQRMDISLQQIRDEIERQVTKGDGRLGHDMQLTPRSKRVIDLAYDEARQLSNNYIGTEHLVLGLIREGDGLAGRVLAKLGVELERTRREVMTLQDSATKAPTASPSSPSVLDHANANPARSGLGEKFAEEFEKLEPEVQAALQGDGVVLNDLPESMVKLLNEMFPPVTEDKGRSPSGMSFSRVLDLYGPVVVGVVTVSRVKQYTVAATATLIANYLVVQPSPDSGEPMR